MPPRISYTEFKHYLDVIDVKSKNIHVPEQNLLKIIEQISRLKIISIIITEKLLSLVTYCIYEGRIPLLNQLHWNWKTIANYFIKVIQATLLTTAGASAHGILNL